MTRKAKIHALKVAHNLYLPMIAMYIATYMTTCIHDYMFTYVAMYIAMDIATYIHTYMCTYIDLANSFSILGLTS